MAKKVVALRVDEAELERLKQAGLTPTEALRRGLDLLEQELERQAFRQLYTHPSPDLVSALEQMSDLSEDF